MEFVLEDVNIYERNIKDKVSSIIDENIKLFSKEKYYKIEVTYKSISKVFDNSVYNFEFINSLRSSKYKIIEKDLPSEALTLQLHGIWDRFNNNGIKVIESSIYGEPAGKDIIKITIEDILKKDQFIVYNISPEMTPEERKNIKHKILKKLYDLFYE